MRTYMGIEAGTPALFSRSPAMLMFVVSAMYAESGRAAIFVPQWCMCRTRTIVTRNEGRVSLCWG